MLERTLEKAKGNYQQQLSISLFPAGTYFITVQSGNETGTKVFIKK
jgi:hypothetical protein